VRVFTATVMVGMVRRRLKGPDRLQEGDETAVFGFAAVRPFVELIGVHSDENHEPDHPVEPAKPVAEGQGKATHDEENIGAMEPGVSGEVPRVLMVQDIWPRNPPPGDRPIGLPVGIFEPVKETGQEVDKEDTGHAFQSVFQDQHGKPPSDHPPSDFQRSTMARREENYVPQKMSRRNSSLLHELCDATGNLGEETEGREATFYVY
jgi:hypothetical protein